MMNSTVLPLLSAPDLAASAFRQAPILEPLLSRGSQGLLYGPAGVGKSFLALGIAWAAASGTSFLGWRATRPHRVVYVDGEMTPAELQRRLALFGTPPPTLEFWLAALNPGPVLDLEDPESQERLMASWGDPELGVLDNVSSLSGLLSGDDRWHLLQRFLLLQRRNQRAMLLVHHANRDGQPRGLGRREDVLDFVMALRHPAGWQVSDGACFEIHFEKSRSLHGAAVQPVLAHLQDGRWQWQAARTDPFERGVALLRDGLGAAAMGRALGISRTAAFGLQKLARQLGRVPWRKGRTRRAS